MTTVDELFRTQPLENLQEVLRTTGDKVFQKGEEVRELVGTKYHGVLEASDKIAGIYGASQEIHALAGHFEKLLKDFSASLKDSNLSKPGALECSSSSIGSSSGQSSLSKNDQIPCMSLVLTCEQLLSMDSTLWSAALDHEYVKVVFFLYQQTPELQTSLKQFRAASVDSIPIPAKVGRLITRLEGSEAFRKVPARLKAHFLESLSSTRLKSRWELAECVSALVLLLLALSDKPNGTDAQAIVSSILRLYFSRRTAMLRGLVRADNWRNSLHRQGRSFSDRLQPVACHITSIISFFELTLIGASVMFLPTGTTWHREPDIPEVFQGFEISHHIYSAARQYAEYRGDEFKPLAPGLPDPRTVKVLLEQLAGCTQKDGIEGNTEACSLTCEFAQCYRGKISEHLRFVMRTIAERFATQSTYETLRGSIKTVTVLCTRVFSDIHRIRRSYLSPLKGGMDMDYQVPEYNISLPLKGVMDMDYQVPEYDISLFHQLMKQFATPPESNVVSTAACNVSKDMLDDLYEALNEECVERLMELRIRAACSTLLSHCHADFGSAKEPTTPESEPRLPRSMSAVLREFDKELSDVLDELNTLTPPEQRALRQRLTLAVSDDKERFCSALLNPKANDFLRCTIRNISSLGDAVKGSADFSFLAQVLCGFTDAINEGMCNLSASACESDFHSDAPRVTQFFRTCRSANDDLGQLVSKSLESLDDLCQRLVDGAMGRRFQQMLESFGEVISRTYASGVQNQPDAEGVPFSCSPYLFSLLITVARLFPALCGMSMEHSETLGPQVLTGDFIEDKVPPDISLSPRWTYYVKTGFSKHLSASIQDALWGEQPCRNLNRSTSLNLQVLFDVIFSNIVLSSSLPVCAADKTTMPTRSLSDESALNALEETLKKQMFSEDVDRVLYERALRSGALRQLESCSLLLAALLENNSYYSYLSQDMTNGKSSAANDLDSTASHKTSNIGIHKVAPRLQLLPVAPTVVISQTVSKSTTTDKQKALFFLPKSISPGFFNF